jgi:hypothetical protein
MIAAKAYPMPSLRAWPKEKHIKTFSSRGNSGILLIDEGIDAFQKRNG